MRQIKYGSAADTGANAIQAAQILLNAVCSALHNFITLNHIDGVQPRILAKKVGCPFIVWNNWPPPDMHSLWLD